MTENEIKQCKFGTREQEASLTQKTYYQNQHVGQVSDHPHKNNTAQNEPTTICINSIGNLELY